MGKVMMKTMAAVLGPACERLANKLIIKQRKLHFETGNAEPFSERTKAWAEERRVIKQIEVLLDITRGTKPTGLGLAVLPEPIITVIYSHKEKARGAAKKRAIDLAPEGIASAKLEGVSGY